MHSMKKRDAVFDIEKGFLIILVIMGHLVVNSSLLHQIIFSFHMPVFFMITGMLSHWGVENGQFVKKRARSYVIPYFSWCIVLFLMFWIENPLKYLVRILYGGAMNTTHYTYPYWFICCLFLSSVLFNSLWKYKKALLVVLTFYLMVWYIFLSHYHVPLLPWSLEIVPFAILYFVIGIVVRRIEEYAVCRCGNAIYIVSFILASLLILIRVNGYSHFTIIMETAKLNCFPLDIIYPVTYYLAIKGISLWVARMSSLVKILLIYMGNASLVIMFSHAAIFVVCSIILPSYISNDDACKIVVYSTIALMIGCVGYSLLSRNKYFSLLFLGR